MELQILNIPCGTNYKCAHVILPEFGFSSYELLQNGDHEGQSFTGACDCFYDDIFILHE